MSKAMSIIGIAIGAIVAGVLTGGAAFIGITAVTATMAIGIGAGVGVLAIAAGGTLSTVASWSGGSRGAAIGGGSPTYSWGKLQTLCTMVYRRLKSKTFHKFSQKQD